MTAPAASGGSVGATVVPRCSPPRARGTALRNSARPDPPGDESGRGHTRYLRPHGPAVRRVEARLRQRQATRTRTLRAGELSNDADDRRACEVLPVAVDGPATQRVSPGSIGLDAASPTDTGAVDDHAIAGPGTPNGPAPWPLAPRCRARGRCAARYRPPRRILSMAGRGEPGFGSPARHVASIRSARTGSVHGTSRVSAGTDQRPRRTPAPAHADPDCGLPGRPRASRPG